MRTIPLLPCASIDEIAKFANHVLVGVDEAREQHDVAKINHITGIRPDAARERGPTSRMRPSSTSTAQSRNTFGVRPSKSR